MDAKRTPCYDLPIRNHAPSWSGCGKIRCTLIAASGSFLCDILPCDWLNLLPVPLRCSYSLAIFCYRCQSICEPSTESPAWMVLDDRDTSYYGDKTPVFLDLRNQNPCKQCGCGPNICQIQLLILPSFYRSIFNVESLSWNSIAAVLSVGADQKSPLIPATIMSNEGQN